MKRLLFFAIPIVLALWAFGAGADMLKQKRAFDSAKLRGNNELCNVHIYSLNQQLGRNNLDRQDGNHDQQAGRVILARSAWWSAHRVALEPKSDSGLSDEDLRTCLLMKEDAP
jgi:hypothetical protein